MSKRKYKPRRARHRPVLASCELLDIKRLHNQHSEIIHLIAAKIEDFGFYLSPAHLELLKQADIIAHAVEMKMKQK